MRDDKQGGRRGRLVGGGAKVSSGGGAKTRGKLASAKLLRLTTAVIAVACCLALASCGGKGQQAQKSAASLKSDFERGLDTIRTGRHAKIYVIRRADGQPFQPEDRKYLRDIEPMKTGMWVVTQDGATAIAGAGFEFEPPLLADISKRFTVEDYTNK